MQTKLDTPAEFVPVRWWQLLNFIRLYFEVTRGRDPWTDGVLAHPWSPASILAYLYTVDNFFHMQFFFIQTAGERVGVIAIRNEPTYVYMDVLGVLPEFQRRSLGRKGMEFIWLKTRHAIAIGTSAVRNIPVHKMINAMGGRVLGLSTTTLEVKTLSAPESSTNITCQRLSRPEAETAWRRWRLYEVEQTGGAAALEAASHLLEKLPTGQYVTLFENSNEIGFAFLHLEKGGSLRLGLFPTQEYWASEPTAQLVTALRSCLAAGQPTHLTLTQTHANALTLSETFNFERGKNDERHLVFIQRV